MKKTLAAVAILGAFAGSALADVTVYGRVNTSLHAQDTKTEWAGVEIADKTTWDMATGDYTGSRVGIKGSEKLAEGLTAGFVFEKGFKGDTGAAGDSAKAFDREAIVYLATDYGTFGAGRMAAMVTSAGSWALFGSHATFVGTGTSGLVGTGLFANATSRWDNMLAYKSPMMGGFQVYAQYSMGDKTDNESVGNNRYAALGAKYQAGGLTLVAVADQVNKKQEAAAKGDNDAYTFNLGGNYNFGVASVSLGAQYFKGKDDIAGVKKEYNANADVIAAKATVDVEDADGYGVTFGVKAPCAGGNAYFSTTYVDGDATVAGAGEAVDVKAWNVGAMYDYNLSKNTFVYASVAYTQVEAETVALEGEKKTVDAYVGLVHKF